VTVRWGDMDALGHVNNCAFLQYLECARVGYFETMGWDSRDTAPNRKGPIVVSQTFNYRRQLHYPAELEVGVVCSEIRNRSFVLSYAVFGRGTDDLYGDGSTVLVWLDVAANKALELPSQMRAHLSGE
jgi:acyl-CoA thioester hydrolase